MEIYKLILDIMPGQDLHTVIDRLEILPSRYSNAIGITRNHPSHSTTNKRSILPFGNVFSLLFGAGSNNDTNDLKENIKILYHNQAKQSELPDEVITVINFSRGLIDENVLTVNRLIDSVTFWNETLTSIHD